MAFCYDNLIGIRGECSGTLPILGLYLGDLPGMNMQYFASLADAENAKGIDLAKAAIQTGIRRLRADLIRRLQDRVLFGSIAYSQPIARWDKDSYLAGLAGGRGAKVNLESCCRLLGIYIPSVRVRLKGASTALTLTIVDGTTTKTYSFTSQDEQEVTVHTNYKAVTHEVSITVDTTLEPNETSLNGVSDCDCKFTSNCKSSELTITGIGADTNQTYGVNPLLQLQCSEDLFFCEVVSRYSQELLYAAGIAVLDEAIATRRVNEWTIYKSIDQVQQVKGEWAQIMTDGLNAQTEAIGKYLASLDSCCVECNSDYWTYQTG